LKSYISFKAKPCGIFKMLIRIISLPNDSRVFRRHLLVLQILYPVDPLLDSDHETNKFPRLRVHAQQYRNCRKRCFLRGPCQDVITETSLEVSHF
jgi:hypothetical protein